MDRERVLINGEAHYDKGNMWYREEAGKLIFYRPEITITLQTEMGKLSGEWETIAEIRGEK